MGNLKVKIKLLKKDMPLPSYESDGAAAMDLRAAITEPLVINPGERALVPTGIAICLPNEHVGAFIFARSGLGTKHGIALANGVGVIDSDYRGEICAGLINLSDKAYTINPMDRIAQMAFLPVSRAVFEVVEELPSTERSGGGFGSTGVR